MAVYIKKEAFKLILAKANITQKSLADETGLNVTHINNMIAGRETVSPHSRKELIEKLEIKDWDSIFEFIDND